MNYKYDLAVTLITLLTARVNSADLAVILNPKELTIKINNHIPETGFDYTLNAPDSSHCPWMKHFILHLRTDSQAIGANMWSLCTALPCDVVHVEISPQLTVCL